MKFSPSALRTPLTLVRALCAALLLNAALPSQAADEPASCPPMAQPPTAEQMEVVQREARDHGFLWRISKGGRNSYLYGTLHVGKLAWTVPGPRVLDALMGSQALALELDLMDEKIVSQLTSTMSSGSASPSASMPGAWQTRIQRQMAAACLPAAALATQHPVMQAITLTVLSARRDGLDPAYAQEFVLSGLAHAANKPVISLETPAQQMSALLPGDAKRARQMAEETLKQVEQGSARNTLLRVAQVWERGDLDELAQYERWCDCITSEEDAAHLRLLNDDRNGPLAERIDAVHSGGQTVFAAVGSLHMTGPKGLPRLLGQRGFTVERVRF